MKSLIFCFLLILLPFQAYGQEMLKENLLTISDRITSPPADVKAAYLRLECSEVNMIMQCSADKFYRSLTDEINAAKLKLEQLTLALAMPASATAQNMDPEEIQRKMATMTPDEQIQFAMQLSEQMGFGSRPLQVESDEVLEALEEHGALSGEISLQIIEPDEILHRRITMAMERDEKHRELNALYYSEHQKLPQVSFGEAGRGPDPQAEFALKVAYSEKHIAVENSYLQTLQTFWPQYRERLKSQYGPLQQKLAAVNYGEDALNIGHKRILVGGQSLLLTPADLLLSLSKEATDNASQWWLEKLQLEKQRPL